MDNLRQPTHTVNKKLTQQPEADWGQRYATLGLSCCPVNLKTKKPKGAGWQERRNQLTTPQQITQALQAGGLGCVHQHSGTATLDLDAGLELALMAGYAAGINLGQVLMDCATAPATMGNRTRPPKLWFRVPEGLELQRKTCVWDGVPTTVDGVKPTKQGTAVLPWGQLNVFELRAGPAQDVLPPSKHPTGVQYTWVNGPPSTLGDFPELPADLQRLWQRWDFYQTLMADGSPWRTGPAMHQVADVRAGKVLKAVRWQLEQLLDHTMWRDAATQALQALEDTPQPGTYNGPGPVAPKPTQTARAAQAAPATQRTGAQDWSAEEWCTVWCEHVTPQTMLERNGYKKAKKQSTKEVARYLAPGSTTGEAGVVVLRGDDGRLRAHSHHGSDALANGHAKSWDAWGLLKLLEHGDNTHHAILSARQELDSMGVHVPPSRGDRVRQGDRILASMQGRGGEDRPPQPANSPPGNHQALQASMDEGVRNLSEDGLALILGDMWQTEHGSRVRYVPSMEQWRVWMDYRWAHDDAGLVERSALDKLRELGQEVVKRAKQVADRDPSLKEHERRKLIASAEAQENRLRSQRVRRAALATAGVHARIATKADRWDNDPWMLATPGGMVDLRTGALRPATPADLVTQSTKVAPAPEGRPALWLHTLHYLMGGEDDPQRAEELVAYLKRLCGYMLTGSVREQVLVFGFGEGRNGKTLTVQTVADLMGDYATTFPTSMLMAQQNESHPTEVARLMGKRLAIGSETEAGRKFAEAKLKKLTGGDRLPARFMRQDFFEFDPQFKLFVVGNHKPDLQHVDVAMRRRLHLVPFSVTVPEHMVDPELPAKLRAEGPAILRWMIDGCLEWQAAGGLRPPAAVLDAVEEYMQEQDAVGAWLQDWCVLDEDAKTPSAEVWAAWVRWCQDVGEDSGTQKALMGKLRNKGCRPGGKARIMGSQGGVRVVQGLRWLTDKEREQMAENR